MRIDKDTTPVVFRSNDVAKLLHHDDMLSELDQTSASSSSCDRSTLLSFCSSSSIDWSLPALPDDRSHLPIKVSIPPMKDSNNHDIDHDDDDDDDVDSLDDEDYDDDLVQRNKVFIAANDEAQTTLEHHDVSHCSTTTAIHSTTVSWGDVEIRKFPIIPGDHPDTRQGPPLTIAWDYISKRIESIDSYEARRAQFRRKGDDLRLHWLYRLSMLRRLGITDVDIYHAERKSRVIRRQRQRTISHSFLGKIQDFACIVMHKINRTPP